MLVEGRSISETAGVCYLGHGKIGFQEQLPGDFDAVLDQIFLRRQGSGIDKQFIEIGTVYAKEFCNVGNTDIIGIIIVDVIHSPGNIIFIDNP